MLTNIYLWSLCNWPWNRIVFPSTVVQLYSIG